MRLDDYLVEAAFSHAQDQRGLGISLRLGIEDLSLQAISVDLNADAPHMLVGGGPGSGRTSVLQTFLVGMAATTMPGLG